MLILSPLWAFRLKLSLLSGDMKHGNSTPPQTKLQKSAKIIELKLVIFHDNNGIINDNYNDNHIPNAGNIPSSRHLRMIIGGCSSYEVEMREFPLRVPRDSHVR